MRSWLANNAIALILIVVSSFGAYTAVRVGMAETNLRLNGIEQMQSEHSLDIRSLENRMTSREIDGAKGSQALEGLVLATTELTREVGRLSIEVGKLQVRTED